MSAIIDFETLLSGYTGAVARFQDARRTHGASRTFHSLFEALNWAVVLDDHVSRHWTPPGTVAPVRWKWRNHVGDGGYVRALRFARNRVHHQWADALVNTEGAELPSTLPLALFEWRWRSSTVLPTGSNMDGLAEYDQLLAGSTARMSLDVIASVYKYVQSTS